MEAFTLLLGQLSLQVHDSFIDLLLAFLTGLELVWVGSEDDPVELTLIELQLRLCCLKHLNHCHVVWSVIILQ